MVLGRLTQRLQGSAALSLAGLLPFSTAVTKPLAPVPALNYSRKAVIYIPSGPAAQYGYDQKAMHGGEKAPWKIWLPAQEMWTNPLMGWAASSDTAESAFGKMSFRTADEASAFLRKQGIQYEVEAKPENWQSGYRPPRYYQYGDNFSVKRKGMPDVVVSPRNRQ
eukprot:jgi/Ulvmu1/4877/UM020_0163.1